MMMTMTMLKMMTIFYDDTKNDAHLISPITRWLIGTDHGAE